MLELLAGPYPMTDLSDNAVIDASSSFSVSGWVDPDGFIVELIDLNRDKLCFYLAQMDGSAYEIGDRIGTLEMGLCVLDADANNPDVGQRWYAFFEEVSSGLGREWMVDRVTRMRGLQLSATVPAGLSGSSAHAHLHDRYLRANGSNLQYWNGSAWVTECSVSGFSNPRSFSWARERNEIWVGSNDGRIFRYNYVTKTVASIIYQLSAHSRVYYSAKRDVFVSFNDTGSQIDCYVWARTPAPASILAPAASGPLAVGKAVTLTARVLGSNSEPCADEVVAWSLVSGPGQLLHAATKTDADGYAANQLLIPVGASGASTQVGVEVAY